MAEWVENLHPRAPKGSLTGGQFTHGSGRGTKGVGRSVAVQGPEQVIKKFTSGKGLVGAHLLEDERQALINWADTQPRSKVTTYRGVWDKGADSQIGDRIVLKALSSFTEDPIRASAYGEGGKIFVKLELPPGHTVDISKLSVYPEEQEHILPHDTSFTIAGRKYHSGMVELKLGSEEQPRMASRLGKDVATDLPEHIYHVTLTKNITKIKKEGLQRFRTSQWLQAGTKERYGQGEIYAFEDEHDAKRWAAKMDWDLHKETGSGKVSIVKLRSAGNEWLVDTADPISQAGARGRWLKSELPVKAENIIGVTKLDQTAVRSLVERPARRGEKAPQAPRDRGEEINTRIQTAAERVAKEEGFKGKVTFKPVKGWRGNLYDTSTMGEYDQNSDEIFLYTDPVSRLPSEMVEGVTAHEVQHHKFNTVIKEYVLGDQHRKELEPYFQRGGKFREDLEVSGHLVSNYASEWWDRSNSLRGTFGPARDVLYKVDLFDQSSMFSAAVNETLAEVAMRRRLGTSKSVPKVWNDLYDKMDALYREGQGKREKRD